MGFWSVESFGSLSKKSLNTNPVCAYCGKPAKFNVIVVEHDYEGDLTDCESNHCCRVCYKRIGGRRVPRAERRTYKSLGVAL